MEDLPHSGRSVKATTAEHRAKLVNLVAQSSQKLPKRLSTKLGVSQTSVRPLARQLSYRPYYPRLIHTFNDDNQYKRAEFREQFPEMLTMESWISTLFCGPMKCIELHRKHTKLLLICFMLQQTLVKLLLLSVLYSDHLSRIHHFVGLTDPHIYTYIQYKHHHHLSRGGERGVEFSPFLSCLPHV